MPEPGPGPHEDLKADLATVLAQLRRKFIAEASSVADRLLAALERWPLPAAVSEARFLIHNLSGLAGSIGFMPIGDAASELEADLQDALPPDFAHRAAELIRLLKQLR